MYYFCSMKTEYDMTGNGMPTNKCRNSHEPPVAGNRQWKKVFCTCASDGLPIVMRQLHSCTGHLSIIIGQVHACTRNLSIIIRQVHTCIGHLPIVRRQVHTRTGHLPIVRRQVHTCTEGLRLQKKIQLLEFQYYENVIIKQARSGIGDICHRE